jgi:hypothetical protein
VTKTLTVEVDCDEQHCDDQEAHECPLSYSTLAAIQSAYDRVTPAVDRCAEWARDPAEPWNTLRQELGIR